MPPKFQSSFIPKGPISSSAPGAPMGGMGRSMRDRSFFSVIANLLFAISVILALGTFGYKYYLNYRIKQMSAEFESSWSNIQPETIVELTNINNRISTTKELINRHIVLTPLFDFLEITTPVTVRFNEFSYNNTLEGLELSMHGEARGYAALAFVADAINKSGHFDHPIFSDLSLNAKGDVTFSFRGVVSPDLIVFKPI